MLQLYSIKWNPTFQLYLIAMKTPHPLQHQLSLIKCSQYSHQSRSSSAILDFYTTVHSSYTLIVGVKKSYTYTCFPKSNFFPSLLRYPKFHKLGFWILCLQCPHRYDNFRIRVFIWPMNHEQQCNVQHSMQNVHKILAVQISQVCFRVSELVEFQS